ncbi:GIY-YIG nuclease family protein [uncultured Alistipes sp.]|uniref:GIY-YIG nuclease family protein n=1 Tax=uncultured Alistipes sp. TaxID=538949 RepID=UPI00272C531E|nr:GIY-YIG nuclease family protein [uncultured Alistipes sp.]
MFGHYFVYLMGSANGRAVYAGMTNDLIRRVREHKSGEIPGFTKRYRCHMLLYYEEYPNVRDAIAREKEIKGWLRVKKERLVASMNPERVDLAQDWFE